MNIPVICGEFKGNCTAFIDTKMFQKPSVIFSSQLKRKLQRKCSQIEF